MAPVVEATAKTLVSSTATVAIYEGRFDTEWQVGTVPNGGYSLGTVNVCVHDFLVKQLQSAHRDLFHISSTYINATDGKIPWTVEVRVTKRGKGFTNLDAILRQKSHKTGEMTDRLQTRLIYTDFVKLQSDTSTEHLTVSPSSPFHASFPCLSAPSECTENKLGGYKKINFRHSLAVNRDLKAQKVFDESGLLNCAAYMVFSKQHVQESNVAQFNNAAILMFADMTEKSMAFLRNEGAVESDHWYPTMFLSVEMKRALPAFALERAACLVVTRHVNHGQFELDVEIWSHPDDAERFGLPTGVKSVVLCIARQVALTIPIAVQAGMTVKKSEARL